MDIQEARQKAKEKVEAKIGFAIHLSIFIAAIVLLTFTNIRSSPAFLWVKWLLIAWGLALVIHTLSLFTYSWSSKVKERMINKELRDGAARGEY